MSGRLHNLTALITGAASGMGRAMAGLFAAEGASVALVDRNADGVRDVASEIGAAGGRVKAMAQDLAETDGLYAMVAEAANWLGGIDIVVNNAGYAHFLALDDEEYGEVWDQHLAVMLTAPVMIIRASLPWLRKSESPRILNFASTEGLGATAGGSPYSAAKGGLISLTRSLAVELGKEGITVNCICPGPIETGINAMIDPADKALYAKRRTSLRRYGEPEEVAEIALSFCTPQASYLTGAIVPVDGGLMARNA